MPWLFYSLRAFEVNTVTYFVEHDVASAAPELPAGKAVYSLWR